MDILISLLAGAVAGIAMGIISDGGYRLRLFRSSQVLVDADWGLRTVPAPTGAGARYALGWGMHIATSAAFGAAYGIITWAFDWDLQSPWLVTLYAALLWVSMLLAALPVAGQGFLGRRTGRWAWLEQAVLHVVFGLVFWSILQLA